ncbi:MAG: thiolase domain-containing protein [Candidatus Njordarchaeia archaeon]
MDLRPTYIIGAGIVKYGKWKNMTSREAALLAGKLAIESAEISPRDIEIGFVTNVFGFAENQAHFGPVVATGLGIKDVSMTTVENACASGSVAIREAYLSVAAGQADVAIAVGAERMNAVDTITANTYMSYGSDFVVEGGSGATFIGLYASMMTRYMHEYGAPREVFAKVAVKNHNNALHNPAAMFHKKITVEDALKSPVIAWPIRLFDCSPITDGAAAVIVASDDFIKKEGIDEKIRILVSVKAGGTSALQDREHLPTIRAARIAADKAFKIAHLERKDIDFAEVHDCFTIAEIVAMEDIGFYKKGEGWKAVMEGETEIGGKIPINPSGGLKAKGHPVGATGIGMAEEVFEQLLGEAGKRQVEGAEIALTHNVGATGGTVVVNIYKRER